MTTAPPAAPTRRFPALYQRDYRSYAWTAALAMAADNVEHVIGYWLIWQISGSPFWLGYAVFAHWAPFILFSAYAGALADRFDSRAIIQVSQVMYVSCSLAWGLLYLTGRLELWHVAVILAVHGLAGVVFSPSSMLIIHEMVGRQALMSAVSINAASRFLASMAGPLIGGLLMASLGPGLGFLANVLLYLPLSCVLVKLPYKGLVTSGEPRGWRSALAGVRAVRGSRPVVGLLCCAGVGSFLGGNAFQALVPVFATDVLGVAEVGYSVLLASFGLGSVLGAVLLGVAGAERARPGLVTLGFLLWSLCVALFALSRWFPVSVAILVAAGTAQMVSASMAQTIVQTWAPAAVRGRVVGLYNMATMGPRTFSGLLVGAFATASGAPVALGAVSLLILVAILGLSALVPQLWSLEPAETAEGA